MNTKYGSFPAAQAAQHNEMGSPETREYQVSSELAALEKSIAVLHERAEKLCDRLTPILSVEPCGQAGEMTAEPSLCPLAESIRNSQKRVEEISGAIADTLRRLEL